MHTVKTDKMGNLKLAIRKLLQNQWHHNWCQNLATSCCHPESLTIHAIHVVVLLCVFLYLYSVCDTRFLSTLDDVQMSDLFLSTGLIKILQPTSCNFLMSSSSILSDHYESPLQYLSECMPVKGGVTYMRSIYLYLFLFHFAHRKMEGCRDIRNRQQVETKIARKREGVVR